MKKFVVVAVFVMSIRAAQVLAQEAAGIQTATNWDFQENNLYEEMEILRRLVSREVTALSTQSGSIGFGGEHPEICAAASRYTDYFHSISSYNSFQSYVPSTKKRVAKVLANYIPDFGIVITMEAPLQIANRASATSEVSDEWNRIRSELSGKGPGPDQDDTKSPKHASLEETLTDLLFKFGPRVSGLAKNEQIAIAASFNSHLTQTNTCSQCHQPDARSSAPSLPFRDRSASYTTPKTNSSQATAANLFKTENSVELLANMQMRQGQLESAKRAFEKLLDAEGVNSKEKQRSASKLAQIYLQLGEYDAAAKTLSKMQSKTKEKSAGASKPSPVRRQFKQLVVKVSNQDLLRVGQKQMSFAEFRDSLEVNYSR